MRELSLHLLDLMQNSLEAGASEIVVRVAVSRKGDSISLEVTDNGKGIPESIQAGIFDPFVTTRTTRKVGLGLPLLKAAAERAGGGVKLESRPGRTSIRAYFILSHIDRAPLGDIAGSLVTILLSEPRPRLRYEHHVDDDYFIFDTAEIERELGAGPLNQRDVYGWVRDYLYGNLRQLTD